MGKFTRLYNFKTKIQQAHINFKKQILSSSVKYLLAISFLPLSFFSVVLVLSLITLTTLQPEYIDKYSIFNAKPHVLNPISNHVSYSDSRVASIEKIFEKYNCPIKGHGKKFVEEADKNNIPYWLVASIAFQESSCGKNVPIKNGEYSYNLWGWAVYGDNVKMFRDIDHGIEVVSKYMNERFYSKGITELCEIMKVYTPPSKGSWCKGVGFFRDQILNYESP